MATLLICLDALPAPSPGDDMALQYQKLNGVDQDATGG